MIPYIQTEHAFKTTSIPYARISGTQLGAIVGKNPWNTPFSVAVDLLRMQMFRGEDENYSPFKAGKYLEPIILKYFDDNGLENTPAEVLFPHYEEGPHNDWKPHFTDDVFTGHVDAIAGHVTDPYNGFGIVECKTTTNPNAWDFENNIPPEYYWIQASLYAHFFGYKDIYFTVAILTPEEQEHPETFVPNPDNTKLMKCPIYPEFDSVLHYARDWYNEFIAKGMTPIPDMNDKRDVILADILKAQIASESEIVPIFDEWLGLNDRIAELQKQADAKKKILTAYIETHQLKGISNGKIGYVLTEYSRNNVDTDKMKSDGIYEQYITKATYKVFKKGKL